MKDLGTKNIYKNTLEIPQNVTILLEVQWTLSANETMKSSTSNLLDLYFCK